MANTKTYFVSLVVDDDDTIKTRLMQFDDDLSFDPVNLFYQNVHLRMDANHYRLIILTIHETQIDSFLDNLPHNVIIEEVSDETRKSSTHWTGRVGSYEPTTICSQIEEIQDVEEYLSMEDFGPSQTSKLPHYQLTESISRDIPKETKEAWTQTDLTMIHQSHEQTPIDVYYLLDPSQEDHGYDTEDDLDQSDYYDRQSIIYYNPCLDNTKSTILFKNRLTLHEQILRSKVIEFETNAKILQREGEKMFFM